MPLPHSPFATEPMRTVLLDLHTKSLEQLGTPPSSPGKDLKTFYSDKLVALDEDKAQALYLILRSINAQRVIEVGTSFGVSTIYLLSAVRNNVRDFDRQSSGYPLVIGTEHEPLKCEAALENIARAFGGTIPPEFSLLEGDLRETIPAAGIANESIDALLLDIWTPMVMPALQVVLPKLRKRAVIISDNTWRSAEGYKEFKAYLGNRENGFETTTMPFDGGLEFSVYVGVPKG